LRRNFILISIQGKATMSFHSQTIHRDTNRRWTKSNPRERRTIFSRE